MTTLMKTRACLAGALGALALGVPALAQATDPADGAGRFQPMLTQFERVFLYRIDLATGTTSYTLLAERAGAPALDAGWAAKVGLVGGGGFANASPSSLPPMPEGGGGGCSVLVTHSSFNFDSGQPQSVNVQAGLVEAETAAASYSVPAQDFPIQFEFGEIVWATANATVPTTTKFTFRIYDGLPSSNAIVESFSSDGEVIPHIEMPVGSNGVIVQVLGDPGDPIFVNNLEGDNAYSVGFRVDEHNNQSGNGCSVPPPPGSNAFPSVDVDSGANPDVPGSNWINAITCPANPCVGWYDFNFFFGICAPSGDWNIRSGYFSFGCNPSTGACCIEDDFSCEQLSFLECDAAGGTFAGLDTECGGDTCPFGACCLETGACTVQSQRICDVVGVYQGDGTTCEDVVCATGACCLPDASCLDGSDLVACESLGGVFQGADSACENITCPESVQACCFASTGGCLGLTPTNCLGAGGVPGGVGTSCASFICFPEGACCLPDGSCAEGVSPEGCAGLDGVFQGDGTACATVECPEPIGACCFDTGFCLDLTEGECGLAGASWAGVGTSCGASSCDDCPEDLDGDGSIGSGDLNVLLAAFGSSDGGDIDGDGDTDSSDLNALLAVFGEDCD